MMMYKPSWQTWSKVGYERSLEIVVELVMGSDHQNLLLNVPFFMK